MGLESVVRNSRLRGGGDGVVAVPWFADYADENAAFHRNAVRVAVLSRLGTLHHPRRDQRFWDGWRFRLLEIPGQREPFRHSYALHPAGDHQSDHVGPA